MSTPTHSNPTGCINSGVDQAAPSDYPADGPLFLASNGYCYPYKLDGSNEPDLDHPNCALSMSAR